MRATTHLLLGLVAVCAACPDLEQREATSDAELAAIAAAGRPVKQLVLWGAGPSDAGLAGCAKLRGLEVLVLRGCAQLTPAGLTALERCAGLRELTLWHCPGIGAAGLERAARIPHLRTLSLYEQALGERDLAALRDARELATLAVPREPGLSQRTLDDLAGMHGLELLDLRGCTGLSLAGVEGLRRALPHCKVLYTP